LLKAQREQVYRFKAQIIYRPKIWREIEFQGKQILADLDSALRDFLITMCSITWVVFANLSRARSRLIPRPLNYPIVSILSIDFMFHLPNWCCRKSRWGMLDLNFTAQAV
jgi:hypothetical protein